MVAGLVTARTTPILNTSLNEKRTSRPFPFTIPDQRPNIHRTLHRNNQFHHPVHKNLHLHDMLNKRNNRHLDGSNSLNP